MVPSLLAPSMAVMEMCPAVRVPVDCLDLVLRMAVVVAELVAVPTVVLEVLVGVPVLSGGSVVSRLGGQVE